MGVCSDNIVGRHPAAPTEMVNVAIFHFTVKVISRARDQSAIAAAAYRSGERLIDSMAKAQSAIAAAAYRSGERLINSSNEVKWYRNRSERIVYTAIFAPPHAPKWMRDRNSLWNGVEQIEKRKNATLAREIECSLPHELTREQQIQLITDFVRENFTRHHLVADLAIHAPDKGADARNDHVHMLIAERQVETGGFAASKERRLQDKQTLIEWRRRWAHLANRYLARFGHAGRIDHRSLAAQGIARRPTEHLGYVASAIERRGGTSTRRSRISLDDEEVECANANRRGRIVRGPRGPGADGCGDRAADAGAVAGRSDCRPGGDSERSGATDRGAERGAARIERGHRRAGSGGVTRLRLNVALNTYAAAIIAALGLLWRVIGVARRFTAEAGAAAYRLEFGSVSEEHADLSDGQPPMPGM